LSRVASRAQVLGFSPSLCFVLWSRVAATDQDLGGSISHTLVSHPHVLASSPVWHGGLVCPMVRVGLAQFTTDPAVRPTPPFLRLEGSRYMSPTGGGRTAALAPVVSTGPGATSGNFKKLDVASASFGGSRHADASSRLIPHGGPQYKSVIHSVPQLGSITSLTCLRGRSGARSLGSYTSLYYVSSLCAGFPKRACYGCLPCFVRHMRSMSVVGRSGHLRHG
jgi:hypothetical protein